RTRRRKGIWMCPQNGSARFQGVNRRVHGRVRRGCQWRLLSAEGTAGSGRLLSKSRRCLEMWIERLQERCRERLNHCRHRFKRVPVAPTVFREKPFGERVEGRRRKCRYHPTGAHWRRNGRPSRHGGSAETLPAPEPQLPFFDPTPTPPHGGVTR